MINIYYKTLKDKKFKRTEKVRPGCWIDIDNAKGDEIELVAELTGLKQSDLQDALDQYEIPRIERQEEGILVYLRYPYSSMTDELYTLLITVIITEKYFITLTSGNNPVAVKILEQSTKIATTQKTKLFLKLLLKITQEFTQNVKTVTLKVPHGQRELKKINSEDFILLAESEETLNQYISALVPTNNVVEAIMTKKYVGVYEEDEDLLQDLLIGLKQSVDICNVSIKSIRSIRDSYQVIFTNNLNKIIKLLTALTIVVTIPNIITGFYGMNVKLPFDSNPFAYTFVLWFMLIASTSVILLFILKKWL